MGMLHNPCQEFASRHVAQSMSSFSRNVAAVTDVAAAVTDGSSPAYQLPAHRTRTVFCFEQYMDVSLGLDEWINKLS